MPLDLTFTEQVVGGTITLGVLTLAILGPTAALVVVLVSPCIAMWLRRRSTPQEK